MTLKTLLPAERLKGKPVKHPARQPSGTLWPTGEFSLGYTPQRSDDDQRLGGFSYVAPGLGPDGQELEERPPLNLSDAPNSRKPRKRGLKGITGFGRNMVKSAGALMTDQEARRPRTFCTLTLPPMTRRQRRLIAKNWGLIVNRTLEWLGRRLVRAGAPSKVVSVTEIQPKRLQATGEGYLHLHLLWMNRRGRPGSWAIRANDLRDWFWALLTRILGTEEVGHVNVNVKPVKGSAARYMAKYMSKGGECLAEALKDWGEDCCPATWWNMTKSCRDWVKSNTSRGLPTGMLIEQMIQYAFNTSPDEIFEFLRHVELEFEGLLLTVGWRGRFVDAVYQDLTAMLKST